MRKMKGRQPLVCHLGAAEVEEWRRFPYITRGYRAGGDYRSCIASLFVLHNECVSAWTMIASLAVGAALFVATMASARPDGWDAVPFCLVFAAQLLHTPCSVGYHLFLPISPRVANVWRRLDLAFVLVLNLLTTFALAYFTFGLGATGVLTGVNAAVAAVGVRNVCMLQAGQPVHRYKIVLVVGLSALGYYIPVVYRGVASVRYGYAWPALAAAVVMVGTHAFGGAAYAFHWPQRQFPGVFDLCGDSHVLMHMALFFCYNMSYPYLWWLLTHKDYWQQNLRPHAS